MIFGYTLEDLLLFNMEVLSASYADYISANTLGFYIGILANVALVLTLKKSLSLNCLILSAAWIFPGYAFFIKVFSEIYWPAQYAGFFCIAVGLGLISYGLFMPQRFDIQSKAQSLFTSMTLLPLVITYSFKAETLLSFGTSALVAALGTLSIFIFQKNLSARLLSLCSALWVLMVSVVILGLD